MVTYVIQQGDTLYKIAKQYDVNVQDIINANPGVNPYNLHVGQVIWIPTPTNQWQPGTQQMPQRQTQQQLPQQTQMQSSGNGGTTQGNNGSMM